MAKCKRIIVFTDLDGSLLDHHSYDYSPAGKALDRLAALNIPVVPVTSKTMPEIEALNLPLGDVPRISENGVGLYLPAGLLPSPDDLGGTRSMGASYPQLLEFLAEMPATLRQHIVGFSDMSVQQVVEATGLPEKGAKLAKKRTGSEPFLWSGNREAMADLKTRAKQAGLTITQGGRFYHLMSEGGKDKAIEWLLERFQQKYSDDELISIALGDGPNDAKMLACVTFGVKIPNNHGHSFDIAAPRGDIIEAPKAGPEGWAAAIGNLLDDIVPSG